MFRSVSNGERYCHDEGRAIGTGKRGCAHVGKAWREGNWTDAKSMAGEQEPLMPYEQRPRAPWGRKKKVLRRLLVSGHQEGQES